MRSLFESAWRLLLSACTAAVVVCSAQAAHAQPLTIQGSSTLGANLLPNQAIIEALSGQSLKIVSIRSDIGLLRLLGGQAEFAAISTSLRRAIDALRPSDPDLPYDRLMAFPVSRIRVAFAVHPSNPVRKADIDVLRRVLSGEPVSWSELGGPDQPIRVAYVQPGGGVTLCVAAQLFGGRPLMPANPIRVSFGSQVIRVVEQEPRALGVAQLGLVRQHQLPELTTDHAIEQELSLVTLGEPSPTQLAVINAVRKVAADLDTAAPN